MPLARFHPSRALAADAVSWLYAIAVLVAAFWFGAALNFAEAGVIAALFLGMRAVARQIRVNERAQRVRDWEPSVSGS